MNVGQFSLILTLLACLWAISVLAYGLRRKSWSAIVSARRAVHCIFVFITLALGVLIYGFATHDFSIVYVANYSSLDLPMFYNVFAFWAGQEGSLLFWLWLLTLFALILVWQRRNAAGESTNYALLVVLISELFFTCVIIFSSNPFDMFGYRNAPRDGIGLSPLLQNPGMLVHPPALFIGYAGFTVPFAYAIGALLSGKGGNRWILESRRWTLISWIFLTIGIVLGGKWAYVVLGWGGYWAWDPIENASLMPWLVATAFLHSVMIQEKRNMFKIWNIALITLTFELCLFGTFLTRSGVVSSVHTFVRSNLPSLFLGFIAASSITVLLLVIIRRKQLESQRKFDALLSRESTFLLNNLILLGLTFATLWGTMYPIISEVFTGEKISVSEPFFNIVNRPIGLALLLLTGICPLISWKKATISNFTKNLLRPLIVAFLGTVCSYIIYRDLGLYSLLCIFSAFFVLLSLLTEFYRGTLALAKREKMGTFRAFLSLIPWHKRRYGGYIVHIGMVIVFLGIMGSTGFKTKLEMSLERGESFQLGDYTVTYTESFRQQRHNANLSGVKLVVQNSGKEVTTLMPAQAFYPRHEDEPISELGIYSTPFKDLYATLSEISKDERAILTFYVNPLVSWIWTGSWVMLGGAIIAILGKVRRPRPISPSQV